MTTSKNVSEKTKVTCLTQDQLGQIGVMKRDGQNHMSDLAIVLGGFVGKQFLDDDGVQKTFGYVGSASPTSNDAVSVIDCKGRPEILLPNQQYIGIRPVLPPQALPNITHEPSIGIPLVKYGEYPQTAVPPELNEKLETGLEAKELKPTGKKYSFEYQHRPLPCIEYEYEGKRYIRIEAKPYIKDAVISKPYRPMHAKLSNGCEPQKGDPCWIEVQPIQWRVVPKGNPYEGWWIAENVLFSGVPFYCDPKKTYDGNFLNTHIYEFLNGSFWRDMQPQPAIALNATRDDLAEPTVDELSNSAHPKNTIEVSGLQRDGSNIPTNDNVKALGNHGIIAINDRRKPVDLLAR